MHRARPHRRRVDDEERVHDRVDLRRLHDAGQDRVVLVAAHVLGPVQLDRRLDAVESDDDIHVVALLECLRDAAAPERAEAGDEDAATHQPNQTDRRWRSMS